MAVDVGGFLQRNSGEKIFRGNALRNRAAGRIMTLSLTVHSPPQRGVAMLTFRRPDPSADAKAPLKPALYEPPVTQAKSPPATPARASTAPPPRENPPPWNAPGEVPTLTATAEPPPKSQAAGSKLFVGINIKLKGVEISDCDVLAIEGHVEATVHSHLMEIAKPGTLKGTAMIDIAEVHGEFSGELTARTRLVVHGTGRVSGTIRYGKLIVAEGGELNGDVKRLDAAGSPVQPLRVAAAEVPFALGTPGVDHVPH
jgi:cytoskeletal protein CcmA (bactofilin family)